MLDSLALFLEAHAGGNLVVLAFYGGMMCALLTFIGSLPALAGTRLGPRFMDAGMGFSSGIMITASFTSLLLPAIELGGFSSTALGFVLGAIAIHVLDKAIPHEHLVRGYEGPQHLRDRLRVAWLIALAIIIHNFPEGLAVGTAMAVNPAEGVKVAVAIGIQDMPEGLAVALPLATIQGRRDAALLLALLSGLSEPLMAVLGAAALSVFRGLLPYALGFAAGAMVYVVSHESLPESHRAGHENIATLGFMVGLLIMLWLDTGL